jgi:predicted deacylase
VDVGTTSLDLPVVLINGAEAGPRCTLIAGVHGGEYVGVEALISVLKEVDPKGLRGQIVACPIVNPPVVYDPRLRNSPLDGLNLNRIFPGDETGSESERLAAWIIRHLVDGADFFVDLHGGGLGSDLVPFVGIRTSGDPEYDRTVLEAAEAFGFEHIVRGRAPDGGNSHAAVTRRGIPAMLIELGQRGYRKQEQITEMRNGLLRLANHLRMLDVEVPKPTKKTRHWVWAVEVGAPSDGLWYPSFEIGDDLEKGSELGVICDPFGNVLDVVTLPCSGKVFYGHRGLTITTGGLVGAIAESED